MRKLKTDELLRVKLGITQQEFADYLGVTRGLLSMHEKQLRSLPATALLKLADLELSYHNCQQARKSKKGQIIPGHPQLRKQHDDTKKSMEEHAAFCHAKKNILQRKLDKMMTENENAEIWLQLIDDMQSNASMEKKKSPDQIWLQARKKTTLKKMMRQGAASQAKLRASIQVLNAEAAVYKKLHTQL